MSERDTIATLPRDPAQMVAPAEHERDEVMDSEDRLRPEFVAEVLDAPRHPYTQGLLNSLPAQATPGERLTQINGMAPSLSGRVPGCAFAPRCGRATPRCVDEQPPVTTIPGRAFRCFVPLEAPAA